MSSILRRTLVFTFVVGLISIYASTALWACGGACGGSEHSSHESGVQTVQTKAEGKAEKAEVVKDPVCGMAVSDVTNAPSEEYKGKVYYFCSDHCKKTFKKDPASFAAKDAPQGKEHKH